LPGCLGDAILCSDCRDESDDPEFQMRQKERIMLTGDVLLEIHERTHRNLKNYLAFSRKLDQEAIDRKMAEVRCGSIRLQFHHLIGAERYWIGVLEGLLNVEEEAHLHPSIESLQSYRQSTYAATREYLRRASEQELGRPRQMFVDPGVQEVYVPGQVVMRTITHIYHHQGQIAWMLRLLRNPHPESIEDFDYPITE
jgi:uncharacterized damage-inducible protein DinB